MASRVLIVDDDRTVRGTLEIALEDEPWEVKAVGSAEEGLEVFRPGEFSALVVDKNLPGKSGVELIAAVRAQDEAVGILMITGYSSVQTALDTLHLGVDGYLEKPFDDIFAVVRDIGDAVQAGERRRASSAGAVDHFARASQHLRALQKDRRMRVLIAGGSDAASWLRGRLGDAVVEVASTRQDVLATLPQRWDLVLVDASLAGVEPMAWISEVREAAPAVALAVVTTRPSFDMVTQLIRLRVRAVLEQPLNDLQYDRRLAPTIERLRQSLGLEARAP